MDSSSYRSQETHTHIMSAGGAAGESDYRSQQEMIEIKMLLKVLVESQAKILNAQLNTQNQILEILKSIGNAALTPSPTALLTPEEDTVNNSDATYKVAENEKNTPSVVYAEITQAVSDDDYHEQCQPHPSDHQLRESTGNYTTGEQNLKSKGDKVMSKKYVLSGYKQLYYAAYNGDWDKASKFFVNNPQAIREVITEELESVLHIAVHRNHLVFVEEIVRLMPPEVLEYKTRYNKSTALHFAVMHGNLKAAEVLLKKNQKLTQIRDVDGRVPLAYALANATGAQEEIVKYLYPVTRDEDPSPFSGHDVGSLLCDAISEGFYGAYAKTS